MKPQVILVQRGIWTWWVVGTSAACVIGSEWELMSQVVAKWEAKYGRPRTGYIMVQGYHTEQEATALLSRARLLRVEDGPDPIELAEQFARDLVMSGGRRPSRMTPCLRSN